MKKRDIRPVAMQPGYRFGEMVYVIKRVLVFACYMMDSKMEKLYCMDVLLPGFLYNTESSKIIDLHPFPHGSASCSLSLVTIAIK